MDLILKGLIDPMAAQLSKQGPFDDREWIYEIKWDGYRAIGEINHGVGNKLYSRNGLSFSKQFKKVFEALNEIKVNAIVDGEIVVYDETGLPSFSKIQHYKNTDKVAIQFLVFDCLYIDGKSLIKDSVITRKKYIQQILPSNSKILKYVEHIEGKGVEFYEGVLAMNLEGMIAKRKTSVYELGKRSPNWLKIKNTKSMEAILIGFTAPDGIRSAFGALLLAVYNGKDLDYIGSVGTGFTQKSLKEIHARMQTIIRSSPATKKKVNERNVTWIEPVLVCSITFTEFTVSGRVRHPSFKGLRIDKDAREVTRSQE